MTLAFTNRCLDNACTAVMEAAAKLEVTCNDDCSDFTDPSVVKQFLMNFAVAEWRIQVRGATKMNPVMGG